MWPYCGPACVCVCVRHRSCELKSGAGSLDRDVPTQVQKPASVESMEPKTVTAVCMYLGTY